MKEIKKTPSTEESNSAVAFAVLAAAALELGQLLIDSQSPPALVAFITALMTLTATYGYTRFTSKIETTSETGRIAVVFAATFLTEYIALRHLKSAIELPGHLLEKINDALPIILPIAGAGATVAAGVGGAFFIKRLFDFNKDRRTKVEQGKLPSLSTQSFNALREGLGITLQVVAKVPELLAKGLDAAGERVRYHKRT